MRYLMFLIVLMSILYNESNQDSIQTPKSLSKSFFYPFGVNTGDSVFRKADDAFEGPIPITITFPFFGKSFTSVYVSTNGILTFNAGVTAYVPDPFPLQSIIGVAPYWTDIDNTVGGDIYFREVTSNVVLNQIGIDIRQTYPVFVNFRPIWAYIVTYDEVAEYGSGNPRINITTQVVIATNGRNSFTIFNYGKLMWPVISSSRKAQAGFNAGDGKTFFVLTGSFTPSITSISEQTNIDTNGKWIFRVDSESITEEGCSNEGIVIFPNKVYYVGGDDLTVTGPCFKKENFYKIKYDNIKEENCSMIDSKNIFCKIPFLNKIGRIPVGLAVNGNYTFQSFIISKDLNLKKEITGLKSFYYTDELGVETVSWGRLVVKSIDFGETYNYAVFYIYIDFSTNKSVTLVLNNNTNEAGTEINLLAITETQISSSMRLAFIGIGKNYFYNDTKTNYFTYVAINKFFLSPRNVENANSMCREWYNREPDPQPTMLALSACWRLLTLVNGNFPDGFGDFKQDTTCNTQNSDSCSFFQNGAKACYRSISQVNGAGKQCCFSADNRLLVGPTGGGSMDAGHPDFPLNHFIKDNVPFFMCCKFSNNCNLYYEKRPSDDGSRWTAPRVGGGSGDPHFITLDGLSYTFNGYGEYMLLEINEIKFTAQVRMTQFKNSQGKATSGTVFTAIAVKGENMDLIQLELNSAKNVDIFLNGRLFQQESFSSLELDGLILYISSERYFIQFLNGINIEIKLTAEHDAFLIVTSVPDRFKSKTRGLLGVFDNNFSNDFTLPNGSVLILNPLDDREIFYKFGEQWKLNTNNSIFSYLDGFSIKNFMNATFEPKFVSDGIVFQNSTLEELAKQQCGNNTNCLFDVSTTGELTIGRMSFEFTKALETMNKSILDASKACVPLSSIYENGVISIETLPNGFEYRFRCNIDYCLKGATVVTCRDSLYDSQLPQCLKCPSVSISTKIHTSLWSFFVSLFIIIFPKL